MNTVYSIEELATEAFGLYIKPKSGLGIYDSIMAAHELLSLRYACGELPT